MIYITKIEILEIIKELKSIKDCEYSDYSKELMYMLKIHKFMDENHIKDFHELANFLSQ